MSLFRIAAVVLLSASVNAASQERFVATLTLPTGQSVVVAEGDFEARSIGSFSVRLYEAASAADSTTFFLAGLVRPREGALESVVLADVDGDQRPEIIVIARSVGTGSYLSAQAFSVEQTRLRLQATAEYLAPDADPVAALRESSGAH